VKYDERSGRSRSHRDYVNIVKVWNVVHSDIFVSTGAMAVQLNLDKQLRSYKNV
jgi:hypothetical protein